MSHDGTVKAIDAHSVHRLTAGQVVIDLQTAVKELVENSLDAGSTNIEIRFKEYGLKSIEVIDNGTGIAAEDYDSVGLKHHTSKLASFEDLTSVMTFGFRGEALSSLCALSDSVTITTAIANAKFGTVLELDKSGSIKSRSGKVARQRGTTVTVSGMFMPLPVRRKELERNVKREFGKALHLLNAYALVPCTRGVLLTVSNYMQGRRAVQLRTDGSTLLTASVSALWGPKVLENLVDLDLSFDVVTEQSVLRRRGEDDGAAANSAIRVKGLISKFSLGGGRTGTDRQFFFINGRPCNPSKVQKAFNEVYRTFNVNQSPFIIADFILPPDSCDINVSPDKRTILLHSENNLVEALKRALSDEFSEARSTFAVNATQPAAKGVGLDRRSSRKSDVSEGGEDPAAPPIADENGSRANSVVVSARTSRSATPVLDADESMDVEETRIERSESPPAPLSKPLLRPIPRSNTPSLHPALIPKKASLAVPPSRSTSAPLQRQKTPVPKPKAVAGDHEASPSPSASSGRTPARIECIIADDEPKGKTREVQMVLDTSGASWSLRKSASTGGEAPPRKKARTDANASSSSGGKSARTNLREHLKGFASIGSQVVREEEDSEGDGDDGDGKRAAEEDPERENIEKRAYKGDGDEGGGVSMQLDETVDSTEIVELQDDTSDSTPPNLPPAEEDADIIDLTFDATDDMIIDAPVFERSSSMVPETAPASTNGAKVEIVRTDPGEDESLSFDIDRVSCAWRGLHDRLAIARTSRDTAVSRATTEALKKDAGLDVEGDASEALTRVLHKGDFETMGVVGQFNLGFIIARRQKLRAGPPDDEAPVLEDMDDLFIVDQHAADEKYNFETLQQTTKIESQRLFRPLMLELTAADKQTAIENIDVLKQNGFEISVSENEDCEQSIRLVAQPVSKNTEFGLQDLEELLHLMHDLPTGTMVRCSKARAMFAMRACRRSTMVGAALNARQMTTIVRHMGSMEQPWNCPHGRPTMRHLSDLSAVGIRGKGGDKAIDWAGFGVG